MKNIVLLLFAICTLGFIQTSNSQVLENNTNNLTLITAPGTYIDLGDWIQPNYSDDGFNIGVQYEHQWEWQDMGGPYVGGEVFYFPDLNDIDYTHIIGRFGWGMEVGNPVGWRYRANLGFRGGRVFRSGHSGPHALLGVELGTQITTPQGLFAKLIYAPDTKTDSAIWGKDSHTVHSVFVGVGLRFD